MPLLKKRSNKKVAIEENIYRYGLSRFLSITKKEVGKAHLEKNYSAKNNRIKNILEICGLENRFYDPCIEFLSYQENIDFNVVEKKLALKIKESKCFLSNALGS